MAEPDEESTENSGCEGSASRVDSRDMFGELAERISYAFGLGTLMFIVVAIPAIVWPQDLARFVNGYTYAIVLAIAYFCVPFARRYVSDIKPKARREHPDRSRG